jgi:hypothetical protein
MSWQTAEDAYTTFDEVEAGMTNSVSLIIKSKPLENA